jgi:hypothetical protein
VHLPVGSSSARPRRASRRARLCALAGAIVCGALVGPANASAADPLGLEGLAGQVQADVFSELAPAVPQPAGAGPQVADPAGAEAFAEATAEEALAEAPVAAENPVAAEGPIAGPTFASASAPLSTLSAGEVEAPSQTESEPRAAEHILVELRGRPGRSSTRTRSSTRVVLRSAVSLGAHVTARSSVTNSFGAASVHQRVEAVSGSSTRARTRAGGRREGRSSVPPSRLPQPPLPQGPQRPDMSSAGQNGGQGVLLPLVIAALAAALAILGFELLPRILPVPAFRKPRRISLPPWHPG